MNVLFIMYIVSFDSRGRMGLLLELYYQQKEREAPSARKDDFVFRGIREPGLLENLEIRCEGEAWSAKAGLQSDGQMIVMQIDHLGECSLIRP